MSLPTPYYQDDAVTLYCGDCREILPSVRADLVFTSPPFNMGKQSGGHANMRDGYASHSDNLPEPEYVAWQKDVLSLLWRSVSPSGAVFYNHKPLVRDGVALLPTRLLPAEVLLRQVIVWRRRGGVNWNASFFCPQHEWILLLAHREWRLTDRAASWASDVWDFPTEQAVAGHPCPFPEDLPTTAILATESAKVVLDPFAGSGTTLVAAKNLGRRAIGIEISEEYCDIAVQRLSQNVLDFGGVA